MVLGALACEKAGIAPEFFIRITMKLYGPLLFLLLLLAGLTGKKGKSIKTGLLALVLLGMSGCGVSLENRVFLCLWEWIMKTDTTDCLWDPSVVQGHGTG